MGNQNQERHAYQVVFEDGKPTLSEVSFQTLLDKGFTEEQINLSIDVLTWEISNKAVKSGLMLQG